MLKQLRAEYADAGKEQLFDELESYLTPSATTSSYATTGQRLQMSEGAVKVAALRLRRRYGEMLRSEIAQTVASAEDVDQEIRGLVETSPLCRVELRPTCIASRRLTPRQTVSHVDGVYC